MEKPTKDRSGVELRNRAHDRRLADSTRRQAVEELERRRRNLRGACIPGWEKAARGPKVDDWDLGV